MNVDGVGPPAEKAARSPGLREAARGFEALLIQALLKTMRATVPRSGVFGGGRGEEIFTGLLDSHFAGQAARQRGGLGLGAALLERYAPPPGEPKGGHLDLQAP